MSHFVGRGARNYGCYIGVTITVIITVLYLQCNNYSVIITVRFEIVSTVCLFISFILRLN